MTVECPHPTPYPDVNAVIDEVFSGARAVLGNGFVGMYLYGSLASGDFDHRTSDVDFIVVTAAEPNAETVAALAAMHASIASGASKWATEVEGYYISRPAIRRYDPAQALHPRIERGESDSRLKVSRQGADGVIQRHILREHGIVLAGPDPRTLVDPVGPDDLRQAVAAAMPRWPAPLLDDPDPLRSSGLHAYIVQTLCRMLYTLEHGAVVSKPVAARWAQTVDGGRWAGLIARALAWEVCWDSVNETLDFLRYTLERGHPPLSARRSTS